MARRLAPCRTLPGRSPRARIYQRPHARGRDRSSRTWHRIGGGRGSVGLAGRWIPIPYEYLWYLSCYVSLFCSVASLLRILRQTTRGSNTHSSLHPRGCSPVVIRDSDGCIFPKSRLTNLITPSWHTIALRVLEQFWIQYHHHYHHHHGGILRRVAARFEEVQQPPEFAGSGRENGREAARLRWVGWIDRFVWVEGLWRIRRVVHQHGYARPARHPDAGCAVHGEAASGAGEPRTGDS